MQGTDLVMLLSGIFAGSGVGLIAGCWLGIRLADRAADRALKALQVDSWNRKNAGQPATSRGSWNRSGQSPARPQTGKAAQAVYLDEHDS